jgi:ABC-type antimicrobial peptide transport system permease subunit
MIGCFLFFIASSFEKNVRNNWKAYYSKTIAGDYYITSIQNLGDDYNFFNPVISERFIPKEMLDYLDKNRIPYTKRIRVGALFYNKKEEQFGGFINLIGMDFEREKNYLSNINLIKGVFNPLKENGILAYKYPDWEGYFSKIGVNWTLFIRDVSGNKIPYLFQLSGLFNLKDNFNYNVFNYQYFLVKSSFLSSVLGLNPDDFTDVVVWDKKGQYKSALSKLARRYGLKFMNSEEAIGNTRGIVEFVRFIEIIIEIFIIIIFLISTVNLNLLSFFERKKELAAMLAMGFKPYKIEMILLLETALFSIISFLAAYFFFILITLFFSRGVSLPFIGTALANQNFIPGIDFISAMTAFSTVVLTVLLSMAYPVFLVRKIDPVQVFRAEN